jgi:hypothetical protein
MRFIRKIYLDFRAMRGIALFCYSLYAYSVKKIDLLTNICCGVKEKVTFY